MPPGRSAGGCSCCSSCPSAPWGWPINDAIVVVLQAPLGALFGHPAQGYLLAKVVATGVAVLWNFFINRSWTFGRGGRTTAQEVDGHAV
jgi:GtrA-like protein